MLWWVLSLPLSGVLCLFYHRVPKVLVVPGHRTLLPSFNRLEVSSLVLGPGSLESRTLSDHGLDPHFYRFDGIGLTQSNLFIV